METMRAFPMPRRGTSKEGIEMKYHHIGIPATERLDGEIDLPHLRMTLSDHQNLGSPAASVSGGRLLRTAPGRPVQVGSTEGLGTYTDDR